MDERIDLTENRIFREKPKLVNATGFNLKNNNYTHNGSSISFRSRILRTREIVTNVLNNMDTFSSLEPINSDSLVLNSTDNYKKIYINIYGKICISDKYTDINQGSCAKCGCKTIIDYDLCSNCKSNYNITSINL